MPNFDFHMSCFLIMFVHQSLTQNFTHSLTFFFVYLITLTRSIRHGYNLGNMLLILTINVHRKYVCLLFDILFRLSDCIFICSSVPLFANYFAPMVNLSLFIWKSRLKSQHDKSADIQMDTLFFVTVQLRYRETCGFWGVWHN